VRVCSSLEGCSHAEGVPIEFCRDVVAVARKGEAALSQIAKDFGISESCLHRCSSSPMLTTVFVRA
jgi:hypothetical protein